MLTLLFLEISHLLRYSLLQAHKFMDKIINKITNSKTKLNLKNKIYFYYRTDVKCLFTLCRRINFLLKGYFYFHVWFYFSYKKDILLLKVFFLIFA